MAARLLALILAVTSIAHSSDPFLTHLAQVRVAEVERVFAHRSMPELGSWNWGEVVGWNAGFSDPAAAIVNGWMASPDHRAILLTRYRSIGCATGTAGYRTYYVCILGIPASKPSVSLPNTATR